MPDTGTNENTLTGRNVGKTCRTHYRGTFNDGTQFDSSYDRGEPLEFVCGAGQMIKGFDAAVADMEVGQQVYLSNQYGQPFPVKVLEKEEKTITFDANHEMAGKELNFKIELVEVK